MTAANHVVIEDETALRTMFREHFGHPVEEWLPLRGDGSERSIIRMRTGASSCIGIVGPHLGENRAFIGFSRSFSALGLPVPALYMVHPSERLYLEEDLGDMTFAAWQDDSRVDAPGKEEVLAMYGKVLRALVRFQIDAAEHVDYSLCYQSQVFSREAMLADMAYFRTMFLEQFYTAGVREAAFDRDAAAFARTLLAEDAGFFLYRDFQSRNIMITEYGPRFIDFQSGRRGALQYDVASLLYDSRSTLTETDRQSLLREYLEEVRLRIDLGHERFMRSFPAFAVLRLMQALGAFGKLGMVNRKTFVLPRIPSRLRHLATLVRASEALSDLPYLRSLLLDVAERPSSLQLPEFAP